MTQLQLSPPSLIVQWMMPVQWMLDLVLMLVSSKVRFGSSLLACLTCLAAVSSLVCACSEPSACSCASSSHALHFHTHKPLDASLNILRDIFVAHYRTHARISVLYSDLETIKHALSLHTIPHHDINLIQCRQALIHRYRCLCRSRCRCRLVFET